MSQTYNIELTLKALEMLEAVSDLREREALLDRLAALAEHPELQGKALVGELRGCRSVRAVGQRYRVVYRIIQQEVVVLVIGVGRRREGNRKDVYAQLQRLSAEERDR